MLRSRENWIVIDVDPSPLDDVILSIPAIVENCFSSGVATAAAIVSGLAPGRFAFTWMVGKSTVGRSLTLSRVYETASKNRIPIMTSAVMTGLRMKSAVIAALLEALLAEALLSLPLNQVSGGIVRRRRRARLRASRWR